MTTIHFVWDDGHTSSESFRDNGEFYSYMRTMEEEGHYATNMSTNDAEWLLDGYDDRDGNRVDIKISSW